jgi:hypothetical protein
MKMYEWTFFLNLHFLIYKNSTKIMDEFFILSFNFINDFFPFVLIN